ncbi:MAG: ABC transporter ATP-binding protein [Caldilineaceae bacterium]|nr:ABC transporter ATP-binding protein [Caldilineaceae bacterium]MDE0336499.1 ABC transporter ATP-binding protein [Caldilineaceae bacterium]
MTISSSQIDSVTASGESAESIEMLLEVKGLKTHFFLAQGIVRALEGVDFTVRRGQTVGLVGESGCGKSITARSIMAIVPSPGRVVEGEVLFHLQNQENGSVTDQVIDMTKIDAMGTQARSIRGGEISMVFQEPMTSLSPVHTIGNQIIEAILLHQDVDKEEARAQAIDVLNRVGMPQPERTIDRYPHQLSGGMRQRAMIAMALSCRPSLLIADEPTTALDVTTQAQILTLMRELQDELGMAIIFITHDLGVIAQMVDYVVVMYLGEVVEMADVDTIFYDPKHPYTQALLRSIPLLGRKSAQGITSQLTAIRGSVPDPYSIPEGCPFHPRCRKAIAGVCDTRNPPLLELEGGHKVRCVLYE